MNMALIAGGAQLLGGLLGGGRRDKRAMRQLREIQQAADDAVESYRADQDRAILYRESDEARLREATGYDLEKLRDDARSAGFNPLTVLSATGGAGYDGRGAVLQTPFISMGDAMRIRVDARLGAAPLAVENAGYVGDAIAGAGAAFTSAALSQAQMLADKEIQLAMASMAKNASAPSRAEARAAVASPFDIATLPVGSGLDYSKPDESSNYVADNGNVFVKFVNGGGTWITPAYAKMQGWKPGQTIDPSDMGDEWSQLMTAAGSFDTWLGSTEIFQALRRREQRINESVAPRSQGFPEFWGVSPTPWDQGDMVFRW